MHRKGDGMAREATITQEQVSTTADAIKSNGGKVSSRAIREVLGSGSMGTILKFLQVWQGAQERKSDAVDDTIDPAIARAISNQIAVKVQDATASVTAAFADLQSETATVIAENERQSAELEAVEAELAVLSEQNAAQAGRMTQLEVDAVKTTAALVTERQAAEAARVSLAKAELRLEAVPKIEAEILQVRNELFDARTKLAQQHEAAAVAMAKLDAETVQRKGSEVQLGEAIRRGDEINKRLESMTEAVTNERLLVQNCQAKLEAAIRELATVNETVGQTRTEAKLANAMVSELREQLVISQNK